MLRGPEAVYNNRWGVGGSDPPPGPRSLKCRCIQEPINCEPDDGYDVSRKLRCRNLVIYLGVIQLKRIFITQVVLVCDNLLGLAAAKCTYSHTVGTAFSESASESMSVSESVKVAIHAGLFNIFSEDLEISATTGYDWTHTTDATKSEQTTIIVEAEAPAGA